MAQITIEVPDGIAGRFADERLRDYVSSVATTILEEWPKIRQEAFLMTVRAAAKFTAAASLSDAEIDAALAELDKGR